MLSKTEAEIELNKKARKVLAELMKIALELPERDYGKAFMAVVGGFHVEFWREYNNTCYKIASEIAKSHAGGGVCG